MPQSPDIFSGLLMGGSYPDFMKRVKPDLSQAEKDQVQENQRILGRGIDYLRKIKGQALTADNHTEEQRLLKTAHKFSAHMAQEVFTQVSSDKPVKVDSVFSRTLEASLRQVSKIEPSSAHQIPPSYVMANLYRATDDILARINEKAGSFKNPSHRLNKEELKYVLYGFTRGTNDLTNQEQDLVLEKGTKVGGILSAGSVYLEIAKLVVEKYGESNIHLNTFVIAVDKDQEKAVLEEGAGDRSVKSVVITDDMIDRGGTMFAALRNAGRVFGQARIVSGKGSERPGEYEKRRVEKLDTELIMMFQDFADMSELGKNSEALDVFERAEKYAKANKLKLTPGWFIRRGKIMVAMGKK